MRPLALLLLSSAAALAEAPAYNDPKPQLYTLSQRASLIDPQAKPHPELNFVFENKGKPADMENASVDTRVPAQGKLVIWLMGHSAPLFERLNSYGLHAIQVHYANGWFGTFGKDSPGKDGQLLGHIRLEAATGEDHSPLVTIPKPDGMAERAHQLVKWLSKEHPLGQWQQFLGKDGLDWSKVIISGASHGSTTAARFAKHQRVDRVVMLCGARDQLETWQGLPSATPANCYFGFSHILDSGWSGDHYCRSWELLGLNEYGPIINVDQAKPPYSSSRRLITDADVKGSDKRAHSAVQPGKNSVTLPDGTLKHEAVWRYLYTHPVASVGTPSPRDPDCCHDLKK
jgi:hypothetical protein